MKVMKTLLKTTFVLFVAAGLTATANAQTADVEVSTTVNAVIMLTPTAVNLGTISQGITTLDANANDVATETNVGVGATAGSLAITGTSGASISVSFTNGTLTDGGGLDPTTFTPSVYLGSSAVTSGSTQTITGGSITLDVGGTLAATSGTGGYATTNGGGSAVTFTIAYN